MAQVYSVNAVGYVNTDLQTGFNLISNPLNNTAGNTIQNLFGTGWNGAIPGGTIVYYFNSTTDAFVIASYEELFGVFDPPAAGSQVVPPGEGVFIFVGGTTPQKVTFVGEVPQGAASNSQIPAGFSIRGSTVPTAGPISGMGFPAADGDIIYEWNPATDQYIISTFQQLFGGWDPQEPNIAVGEAFWVSKTGTGAAWNRNFTVN
jgi:hypothetical protein